eukprot:6200070-Pleurochrysis_carterae.AAC.4
MQVTIKDVSYQRILRKLGEQGERESQVESTLAVTLVASLVACERVLALNIFTVKCHVAGGERRWLFHGLLVRASRISAHEHSTFLHLPAAGCTFC